MHPLLFESIREVLFPYHLHQFQLKSFIRTHNKESIIVCSSAICNDFQIIHHRKLLSSINVNYSPTRIRQEKRRDLLICPPAKSTTSTCLGNASQYLG